MSIFVKVLLILLCPAVFAADCGNFSDRNQAWMVGTEADETSFLQVQQTLRQGGERSESNAHSAQIPFMPSMIMPSMMKAPTLVSAQSQLASPLTGPSAINSIYTQPVMPAIASPSILDPATQASATTAMYSSGAVPQLLFPQASASSGGMMNMGISQPTVAQPMLASMYQSRFASPQSSATAAMYSSGAVPQMFPQASASPGSIPNAGIAGAFQSSQMQGMTPTALSAGYPVMQTPGAAYAVSQMPQVPVMTPTSLSSQGSVSQMLSQMPQAPIMTPTSLSSQGSVSQMFLEGFAAGQMSAQSKAQTSYQASEQIYNKEGADTEVQLGQSAEVQDMEVQDIQHQIQVLQERLDDVNQKHTQSQVQKHQAKDHRKHHAAHNPRDTSFDYENFGDGDGDGDEVVDDELNQLQQDLDTVHQHRPRKGPQEEVGNLEGPAYLLSYGSYCPPGGDIVSAAQCEEAAVALRKKWGQRENPWYGVNDHKYCFFADDGWQRVYYNTATPDAAAKSPPKPNYASVCLQVCADKISVSGGESVDPSVMGTFTKSSKVPTAKHGGRQIYENSNGKHLYFWKEAGNWIIESDGHIDNSYGVVFAHSPEAKCPELASGWKLWDNAKWSTAHTVTVSKFSDNNMKLAPVSSSVEMLSTGGMQPGQLPI